MGPVVGEIQPAPFFQQEFVSASLSPEFANLFPTFRMCSDRRWVNQSYSLTFRFLVAVPPAEPEIRVGTFSGVFGRLTRPAFFVSITACNQMVNESGSFM